MPRKGGVPENLKPLKKGDPAPPGAGRRKGSRSMTTILREIMDAPASKKLLERNDVLKSMLEQRGVKNPTNGEILQMRLFLKGLQGDTKAIEMIIDRLDGKAPQHVVVSEGGAINVGFATDEDEA